jgi:predicted RNase H-like nuclease (RuvC/YqgF family)
VSKKFIILTAMACLVSFGGSFAVGWLKPELLRKASQESAQPAAAPAAAQPAAQPVTLSGGQSEEGVMRAMTKTQLKNLVVEVRDKVTEYENKLKSLESQEQRLQMTSQMVQKDIEKLESLRVELTATVAALKRERDKLEKSMVTIQGVEKQNLTAIAATYDKMQADSAGKILANMTKMPSGAEGGLNDAVKILYYMTERTRGKLLSDLALSEPDLAAVLVQKLKRVVEVK